MLNLSWNRIRWCVLFALSLLIAVALPAAAANTEKVVFFSEFELPAGHQMSGDLIIFGGDVRLGESSQITGDVVMFGGQLDCYGAIHGDIIAVGGEVSLYGASRVNGDLAGLGTNIQREVGAVIYGDVLANSYPIDTLSDGNGQAVPSRSETNRLHVFLNRVIGLCYCVFRSLLAAAVTGVCLHFRPQQVKSAGESVRKIPLQSFGLGTVVFLLFCVVEIVMGISLILIPVALIFLLVYAVLSFFATAAVGYGAGVKLREWSGRADGEMLFAMLGTFIVRFLGLLLETSFPKLGWIAVLLVIMLGLGAVLNHIFRIFSVDQPGQVSFRAVLPKSVRDHDVNDPLEKSEHQ